MSRFNLSALAVRERSITLFLIIVIAVAGAYAFLRLGRAEDPLFTIKVLGPRQAVDHGYHAKEHCPPLCRSNASNSKPWSVISPSTGTDPRFRRVNIDNNGTASWAGGSYDFPGSSLISRIR